MELFVNSGDRSLVTGGHKVWKRFREVLLTVQCIGIAERLIIHVELSVTWDITSLAEGCKLPVCLRWRKVFLGSTLRKSTREGAIQSFATKRNNWKQWQSFRRCKWHFTPIMCSENPLKWASCTNFAKWNEKVKSSDKVTQSPWTYLCDIVSQRDKNTYICKLIMLLY